MKITEDVRKYAAEHAVNEDVAVGKGLAEKAAEFQRAGSELMPKPDRALLHRAVALAKEDVR